jgi:aminopeptidase N
LVRGEALSQLEKAEELEASEVKLILTGNDVQLKKTVLKSVKKLDENLKSEYEQLLNAPSYELIEIALIRLCNDFPDNAKQYMEKVEGIEGTRGHNVLVTALEIKYARFKDVQAAMQLVDMCSNSFDFITRQKAMAALKRLNYSNDKLIINLASGVQKANWKLSSSSGNLLKHIYTNSDNKERIKDVMNLIGFSKDELNRVERFLAD